MLPGLELMACGELAVPADVMQHVVRVESSFNPYAIGVVGGRLARQPRNQAEAVSTARMLEARGFNFSLGIAQVNRYNLASHGLENYERAFETCPNLQAGSRILADCHARAGGDWGKAFSCYYSGNFSTGFRHGYVQKVFASWRSAGRPGGAGAGSAIPLADDGARPARRQAAASIPRPGSLLERRIRDASRVAVRLPPQAEPETDTDPAPGPAPAPAESPVRTPVMLQPHGAPPLGTSPPVSAPGLSQRVAPGALPALGSMNASPHPAPPAKPSDATDAAFVF
ncbi:lytic transglycosylase domain-containing protein [Luteimonas kalidii]|uniref:lytic transglycosylase domain-containing protein n=1 Tax=Luteimonas kalidii TaxID=3042025 RepID=UPI002F42B468